MEQPIVVSKNAALIDGIQAAARYIVVIVTFVTALLGLMKTHDIAGIIAYIEANGGSTLAAVSGLIALVTAAYGIFKSQKRGGQVASVAANPVVPPQVAVTKEELKS